MIKIEELEPGSGDAIASGHTVTLKYVGSFPDGKVFDQGQFSFRVGDGRVIPGFDLGVQGMCQGGKRRVTIPPELGYGAKGAGSAIPPNATLVFDLEILSFR